MTTSDRTVWRRLGGMVVGVALATAACGTSEESPDGAGASTQPSVTTNDAPGVVEYVGTLDTVSPGRDNRPGDYFVGITVEDGGRVDAYVCDGYGNAHWLEGTESDGRLQLASGPDQGLGRLATAVTLDGVLRGDRIEGTLTAREGARSFTALAATGSAGVYTFRKQRGGVLTARSDGGIEIEAEVSRHLLLRGRVTYPDGTEGRFESSVRRPIHMTRRRYLRGASYRDYRVVILPSGVGRGSRTLMSAAAPGGGTPYSSWWIDLP